MNVTRKALLMASLVLACCAFYGVGSASATVLCKSSPANNACPPSDVYGAGTTVSAHSSGAITFKLPNGTTYWTCKQGTFSGSVSNAGSATSSVSLSNSGYKFTECSGTTTSIANGSTTVNWTAGTHDGLASQQGNEFRWTISGTECSYSIVGPITVAGGSSATLTYSNAKVVKTQGGPFCSSELKLDASFVVDKPAPLYVEQKVGPTAASVLCKTNSGAGVCPAGDVYGVGTVISAQSSSVVLSTVGGSTLASCGSGSFSGTVSNAGSETTSARLSSTEHTYSSCSATTTQVSNGEAKIDWATGSVDGVLTQTGGATQWSILGTKCTYSVTGGEIRGGTSPKLVYENATAVKTAGGFLCPAEARMNAEYTISSPTPLYVQL